MKSKATWFHGGCDVCTTAEHDLVDGLDKTRFDIEKVNLVTHRARLGEAEKAGIKTLPALLIGSQVFHVNHGADLSDLK